jgi:prophage tail gpP-like protein
LRGKPFSKVLIDNPVEQALLRSMAQWRAAGWKLERIAEYLNSTGHLTKLGCQWRASNVLSVLQSRHTAKVLGRL